MNIKYYQKKLELGLSIEQSLLEQMKEITRQHFPNEFGGVLVGHYFEDNKSVFVQNFVCPKKYKQSPTFFERHPKFINKELKRIYQKSQGQTFYIGEWHSHPNMKPNPSLHDLTSMLNLLSNDIKITNPLLLIIGGDKFDTKVKWYILHQNKLLKYEPS